MIIKRILKNDITFFTIVTDNRVDEVIKLYRTLNKFSNVKELYVFGNFNKNIIYENKIKGIKYINMELKEKHLERISECFLKCSKFSKRAIYLDRNLFFIRSILPLLDQTKDDKITVFPNYVYEGIHIFDKTMENESPDNINEYKIYQNNFISSNMIIMNFKYKEVKDIIKNIENYLVFDLFVLDHREYITPRIKIGYILDNRTILDRIIVKQNGGHYKLGNTFIYKIWTNRASFIDLVCIDMKNYETPSLIFKYLNSHKNSVYNQSDHLKEILNEYAKIN